MCSCLFIILKNKQKFGYAQTPKDNVENKAKKEGVKDQQQQNVNKQYDANPKIKLLSERVSVKKSTL